MLINKNIGFPLFGVVYFSTSIYIINKILCYDYELVTIAMMDKCTDEQKKDSVLLLHISYVMIKK
jgi:hypothetical protein